MNMKDYPRTKREDLIIVAFTQDNQLLKRLVIIATYLIIAQLIYLPFLWTILFVGYNGYMAIKAFNELRERIENILANEPITGQALTQAEKNEGKVYE